MKPRILYIARNIPTPAKKSNGVILDIADKLSQDFEIDFLYPAERVPFFLKPFRKYREIYNGGDWTVGKRRIKVLPYIRLPIDNRAFQQISKHRILHVMKDIEYDIIHAHYVLADGIFAYYLSQQKQIPYIISLRKSDIAMYQKLDKTSSSYSWFKKVLSQAKSIHVLNAAGRDFINNEFGFKSLLIPHGVSENLLLTQQPNYTKNEVIKITSVGVAIPVKQMDWVIQACLAYAGKNKIQLTIIGDGPELEILKSLAADKPWIHFTGRLTHEQVIDHLSTSQIFALPSREETFGLSYLEAAARYNAILAYRNTGIAGIFEEDEEVKYVDTFADFNKSLHHIIDQVDLRNSMQEKAFARVSNLTWKDILQKYKDLYKP